MNKWYRKTGVKAIVLIVAILSGAMLITNLLSLMNLAGSTDLPSLWMMSQQPFEESQEFNYMVENYMDDVLTQIRLENLFETDGMMNRNKEIDVMEYSKNDTANGENVSGIAYSLEELINWGEDFDSAESDNYAKNSVIVCQKPEGTYEYYYTSDFMTREYLILSCRMGVMLTDFCRNFRTVSIHLQAFIILILWTWKEISCTQTAGILEVH